MVDRKFDLDEAAKAIINARSAFGGKSPYAPDVVFVNEFVKKDFLQALVRQVIAAGNKVAQNGKLGARRDGGLRDLIAKLQKTYHEDARIVTEESAGAILEIQSRSTSLLESKISELALIVHGIKSLDDGIDFLTR